MRDVRALLGEVSLLGFFVNASLSISWEMKGKLIRPLNKFQSVL